ncbi:MAG: TetR family transcriptional regulator [Protaetiibacter sp.]
MSEADAAPRRGRRRKDAGDARRAILTAASAEFLANGYDDTSMRAVARRAGVDPALVHHYFDDKAALFAEALEAPVRPQDIVQLALAAPRDRVGETVVRAVLEAIDSPATRDRMRQLVRTALGHDFAARMLRQFVVREVLSRIAAAIDVPDAELRATLAASQIVGLMVIRAGIQAEPLASAPIEEVVARIGPVVQWHLIDYGTVDIGGDVSE